MTTQNNFPVDNLVAGGDDASTALRMAQAYEAAGIDPAMAYDNPDDAALDFGPNGFRGIVL